MPYFRKPLSDDDDFLSDLETLKPDAPAASAPSAEPSIFDRLTDVFQSGAGFFAESQKLSASDFTSKFAGVCKPTNEHALLVVQLLQKQINRVSQAKGFTKIAVDGDLGPGTLAAFRKVQQSAPSSIPGNAATCMSLAVPDLHDIAMAVKAHADALGVSATVAQPKPAVPPTFFNPKTQALQTPSSAAGLVDAFKTMPMPMKIAFGGIFAGIGYFAFFDKKRRRR